MADDDKKHPCPDCRCCQWCSDDRCRLCLRSGCGTRRKMTLREQVELYERLNATKHEQPELHENTEKAPVKAGKKQEV